MYWLYFDLRQQLREHRIKIEQGKLSCRITSISNQLFKISAVLIVWYGFYIVSACNQLLPDALQRWHESSKWLEKNQSAINSKFVEVQTQLDNIEKEVTITFDRN